MPDYNFLNLSPIEFEDLSRDILQKSLGVPLETFTNGRDNGIDLRYSTVSKLNFIVQCKRYASFNSLYSNLKSEVHKLEKLKPHRYIITTSVGLTPLQKGKIQELFPNYIISTSDIYGKEDLNNWLGLLPQVEKQHFKLWLSSTNILDKITHSRVLNQSNFENEKIKETINIYVENDSYFHALDILKHKKYVIISGIPGIGKTTLARILVYHFLANGFEEFIFLSDSIKEGYELYKEGIKQVFLFDDFLGRNFLENKLSNNEEQRIIKFIESVNKSNDKILILTTREYILTQAKQKYDIFENPGLEFAKCVIDLSQYTNIVRAKILYNHLYFSRISEEYINDILKNQRYNQIIQHRNYNPRIIETITNPDIWQRIHPNDFSKKVIEFLNYPEGIWKHVYENQISRFSQCMLANIMSMGTPVLLADIRDVMRKFANNFSNKYGIIFSEIEFKKSVRELENTFIITKKDSYHEVAVEYQNPSVQDFLVNYLANSPDLIKDIISSSIFLNQLFRVFTVDDDSLNEGTLSFPINKIIIKDQLKGELLCKLINDFDSLSSSSIYLIRYQADNTNRWIKTSTSIYKRITDVVREINVDHYPQLKKVLSKSFGKVIHPRQLTGDDLSNYIKLLNKFKDDHNYDGYLIIKGIYDSITILQETLDFEKLQYYFPNEYERFINNSDFPNKIYDLMYDEVYGIDDEFLENALEDIENVGDTFGIDYWDLKEELEKRIQEKNDSEEEDIDWGEGYHNNYLGAFSRENEIIKDMFDSLSDGKNEE